MKKQFSAENLNLGLKRIQRIIVDQGSIQEPRGIVSISDLNPNKLLIFVYYLLTLFLHFNICINCLIEQCFFHTPEEWGVKWMKRRERIREMGKKEKVRNVTDIVITCISFSYLARSNHSLWVCKMQFLIR